MYILVLDLMVYNCLMDDKSPIFLGDVFSVDKQLRVASFGMKSNFKYMKFILKLTSTNSKRETLRIKRYHRFF